MPVIAPRRSQYRTRVKRSAAGLGLFADQPIPRRQFVINYWGDLLTDDVAQARGGKYLFELGNGNTVDGKSRQNVARYINHGCEPNCEIKIVGNEIRVVSVRKINVGEELTYDYDTEYFDEFIKPHGCRCNSCSKKKGKKS